MKGFTVLFQALIMYNIPFFFIVGIKGAIANLTKSGAKPNA